MKVHGVQFVEPHTDLEIILPDANVLDEFDIVKSTFTQTKNAIRSAIRDIIKSTSVHTLKDKLY